MNDLELIQNAAALILAADDEWTDAPQQWRASMQDWRDGYDEHRERQRLAEMSAPVPADMRFDTSSIPPDATMLTVGVIVPPPPEAFEDGVIQPDPPRMSGPEIVVLGFMVVAIAWLFWMLLRFLGHELREIVRAERKERYRRRNWPGDDDGG